MKNNEIKIKEVQDHEDYEIKEQNNYDDFENEEESKIVYIKFSGMELPNSEILYNFAETLKNETGHENFSFESDYINLDLDFNLNVNFSKINDLFNNKDFIKQLVFSLFEKSNIQNFVKNNWDKLHILINEERKGIEKQEIIMDKKDFLKKVEEAFLLFNEKLEILSEFFSMTNDELKIYYFKYIAAYVQKNKLFHIYSINSSIGKDLLTNSCCSFLKKIDKKRDNGNFYNATRNGILNAMKGKFKENKTFFI